MARVVFDLDGTLIDSAPDICGIANRLLAARGVAPITLAEARGFIGNGAAVFIARMRAARAIPDSEQTALLADFIADYDAAVGLTTLYPGVREALAQLVTEGHVLGICTNKPARPARAVLDHFGLTSLFGVIIGGDSLPQRKPDPAPLHAAFAALAPGPQVYVGDSEVDADTATAADVPFLLFTEGYRKSALDSIRHAAAFDDHAGLPALVAALAVTP